MTALSTQLSLSGQAACNEFLGVFLPLHIFMAYLHV